MKTTPRCPAASSVVTVLALAALLSACGRGDEQQAASTGTPAGSAAAPEAQATAPAESPDEKRMANAVVTGKTTAPVDLKYDVLARPEVGQPFEIELVLMPRLAADALEVEATGIPGLTVVSGGTTRMEAVVAGERYTVKVLVQADAPGIYYANVVAKMITQVQTEARTFSIPVVVGAVPAVQKTEPARDAAGEAVQSLPAVESGGPAEPAKK